MPRRDISQLLGRKFNLLTVIGVSEKKRSRNIMVKCKCDCGNETDALPWELENDEKKSCGCLWLKQREKFKTVNLKHGMSAHPLDAVYQAMTQRCYNPNDKGYKNYGGRGIKVCSEWKNDRVNFFEWALNNGWEKSLELDRKDNNGDYTPLNCRFVTKLINARNKRNNLLVKFNGETKTLREWCDLFSLKFDSAKRHIFYKKMPAEDIFPVNYRIIKISHSFGFIG